MDEQKPLTYDRLQRALVAFGYVRATNGPHAVFQHPEGRLAAVFPLMRPNEIVRPVHRQIAENTVRDDGLVDWDDYQFYLTHGKKHEDLIQKGDRLVWLEGGQNAPVVAAATEEDGVVIIKQRNGAFTPCPVSQLKIVGKEKVNVPH